MARNTFRYTQVTIPPSAPFPNGLVVNRPYMIARLSVPSTQKHLTCIVWPDSGADHCVFPISFALALGLDLLKMPRQVTGGVGNTGNVTYYETVDIDLGIGVVLNPLVGFTAGMDAQGIGLLGQAGFFEHFRVEFDHANTAFHIDT